MKSKLLVSATIWLACTLAPIAPTNAADPVIFSTGNTTDFMAAASRPDSTGKFEIETADDFFITLANPVITGATFTGLITGTNTTISNVTVEVYRIFPLDSDTTRTSGPPTFSTTQVPTRVNSPSDVALDSRSLSPGQGLTFTSSVLNVSFTALNSIAVGGIHPLPGPPAQATGGNGQVTGQEVQFNLSFTTPFVLAPGHYFFVPQVQTTGGDFLWLSADRPIVPPAGTPFPVGTTDLQGWTRDAALDPDWLRVGTDIVDALNGGTAPTFNFSFQLEGVPAPIAGAGLPGLIFASGGLLAWWRRKRKAQAVA
jgi:hypothetical protein